ncbi:cyclin family protein [Chryseobacterium sp. MYb264]|uniref:cyclin family protein n=1 Tax=Chryseobacterium sp. MYb264 TaxID=2745153 RepID=UPI002E119133|nr:cyclin family protein [Chryseobacterium sp. MYb264]
MNLKIKILGLFITIMAINVIYSQQSEFKIIDLAQLEIKTLHHISKNSDSTQNDHLISKIVFKPYQNFWRGYMGDEKEFIKWYRNNMFEYENKNINIPHLSDELKKIQKEISNITRYEPKGTWYIVYGAAWTDMGGFSDGTMLIDLAHKNNSSIKNIIKNFPHELSHQIYSNNNMFNDTTALKSIIDEGLAVYVNELYWKNKYSLAEHLGYSENELLECMANEKLIADFFNKNKFSTDQKIINQFRSRSFSISPELPGAIGYFIGYHIIKNYVKKNGKQSWKNVYTESPISVYKSSL